jgi:hypothetical protein
MTLSAVLSYDNGILNLKPGDVAGFMFTQTGTYPGRSSAEVRVVLEKRETRRNSEIATTKSWVQLRSVLRGIINPPYVLFSFHSQRD